jgi:dGTPase
MGISDLLSIRKQLDEQEAAILSPLACLSRDAKRRKTEGIIDQGSRQEFAVDADRVLHSMAYTRYIDKTQVFSLLDNDHITHRVLHVQLVSKIGRSIGRLLRLNEDLIEAIALAHDIGHPPFGHDGEKYLSEKCLEHGLKPFMHNLMSVRFLEQLENGGKGLNLTLQVLDGVLCHDGEVHSVDLTPRRDKSFATLEAEIRDKQKDPKFNLIPMTLEGCVVRITDTIAYIGRDFEDAIKVGLIQREDLPGDIKKALGNTNGTMVYKLVQDLIQNSLGSKRLGFSPEMGEALAALKEFNYQRIYLNPAIKTEHHKLKSAIHTLFDVYLDDLVRGQKDSLIFTSYLNGMGIKYTESASPVQKVRDFIAGMTDEYLLKRYKELVWPRRLPPRFRDEI